MQAPAQWGGFPQHAAWTITEIDPPRSLSYVFTFTDADAAPITPAEAGISPGVPEAGHHTVSLTSTSDDGTRLRMVEMGYATTEARDLSQSGIEQCLDKMAVLVNGSKRRS